MAAKPVLTESQDDTATAILKRKKKPNSLTVTDAVNDDNSELLRMKLEMKVQWR